MNRQEKWIVYGLKSPIHPHELCYVGMSRNSLAKRIGGHRCATSATPVSAWNAALGFSLLACSGDVLEEVADGKIAAIREKHFIELYDSEGYELLNTQSWRRRAINSGASDKEQSAYIGSLVGFGYMLKNVGEFQNRAKKWDFVWERIRPCVENILHFERLNPAAFSILQSAMPRGLTIADVAKRWHYSHSQGQHYRICHVQNENKLASTFRYLRKIKACNIQ